MCFSGTKRFSTRLAESELWTAGLTHQRAKSAVTKSRRRWCCRVIWKPDARRKAHQSAGRVNRSQRQHSISEDPLAHAVTPCAKRVAGAGRGVR